MYDKELALDSLYNILFLPVRQIISPCGINKFHPVRREVSSYGMKSFVLRSGKFRPAKRKTFILRNMGSWCSQHPYDEPALVRACTVVR